MNKMYESGFTGWKDEQDFKKEGIIPENPIIQRILIQTMSWKAAMRNPVEASRYELFEKYNH